MGRLDTTLRKYNNAKIQVIQQQISFIKKIGCNMKRRKFINVFKGEDSVATEYLIDNQL